MVTFAALTRRPAGSVKTARTPGARPSGFVYPPAVATRVRRAPQSLAEAHADVVGHRIGRELTPSTLGPGELSHQARTTARRHLGVDVGRPRLEAGPFAAAKASREGALAVTEGATVSFARGAFAPKTPEGRRLIGHELVHVAHQRVSGGGFTQRKLVMAPETRGESARQDAVKFFDFIGLPQRAYRLSGPASGGELVEARGSRPAGIEHETVWALARSALRYPATPSQLQAELIQRRGIARTARATRGVGFGSVRENAIVACRANPRFWNVGRDSQGDFVIRSNPDVKASAAIRDFVAHPRLYALECFGAVGFVQLVAMWRRLGTKHFDAANPDGVKFRFLSGSGGVVSNLDISGLEEITVSGHDNLDELVPGDQSNWTNGDFNENVIYVGGGEYFAHPAGIVSSKSEIAEHYSIDTASLRLSNARFRFGHWPSGHPL